MNELFTYFCIIIGGNFGGSCTKNDECKQQSGLLCINNKCECMNNAYFSEPSCGKF